MKTNQQNCCWNIQNFETPRKWTSKKHLAEKYGVPRNTVSTWMKNKDNILALSKEKLDGFRQWELQLFPEVVIVIEL